MDQLNLGKKFMIFPNFSKYLSMKNLKFFLLIEILPYTNNRCLHSSNWCCKIESPIINVEQTRLVSSNIVNSGNEQTKI